MTPTFLFRSEAQLDTEEAVFWYDDQKQGLGQVFTDELFNLIRRMAAPLQFPLFGPNIRRGLLSRFPYAVYFLLEDRTVVILAVLHQRRDPAVWKNRV